MSNPSDRETWGKKRAVSVASRPDDGDHFFHDVSLSTYLDRVLLDSCVLVKPLELDELIICVQETLPLRRQRRLQSFQRVCNNLSTCSNPITQPMNPSP